MPGWTKFTFPGRGDKYSSFKWDFNCFTGVDYDAKNEKTAIFKIHGDGKTWAKAVDGENGNCQFELLVDAEAIRPSKVATGI